MKHSLAMRFRRRAEPQVWAQRLTREQTQTLRLLAAPLTLGDWHDNRGADPYNHLGRGARARS
jgi:hypothetical protein